MALAFESNTSLAFDTAMLRECGLKYGTIAQELRTLAKDLDICLADLKDAGWTTEAGTAFYEMVNTGWKENMEKYAALLNTLQEVLATAAMQYDTLADSHIAQTKL